MPDRGRRHSPTTPAGKGEKRGLGFHRLKGYVNPFELVVTGNRVEIRALGFRVDVRHLGGPGFGCGGSAPDESPVMHRGNAGRTGVFAGPSPAKPTEALWRIDANLGSGALVVAGGRLYFVSAQKSLHAVTGGASFRAADAATGREKWRRSGLHSSLFVSPAPVIARAMAYWVAMEASARAEGPASLYALDAGTGEERWRRPLDLTGDDRTRFDTPARGSERRAGEWRPIAR